MIRIYYAHCMTLYDTPQEQRDISTLLSLGFDVVNPNAEHFQRGVDQAKKERPSDYMDYFKGIIFTCQALAFRALPDARIPAGVQREIGYAKAQGIPIIELPFSLLMREMTVEATREYMREVGYR